MFVIVGQESLWFFYDFTAIFKYRSPSTNTCEYLCLIIVYFHVWDIYFVQSHKSSLFWWLTKIILVNLKFLIIWFNKCDTLHRLIIISWGFKRLIIGMQPMCTSCWWRYLNLTYSEGYYPLQLKRNVQWPGCWKLIAIA